MISRTWAFLTLASLLATQAQAQVDIWARCMDKARDLQQSGDHRGAAVSFRDAINAAGRSGGEAAVLLPPALNALGLSYEALGLYNDAERSFERALAVLETTKGRESADYAVALGNLAGVFLNLRQTERAERAAREAIAIHSRTGSESSVALALSRSTLAQVLLDIGRWADAEPLIQQALSVFQAKQEPGTNYLGMALNNLGVIRGLQGRQDESVQLLQRALVELEKGVRANHPSRLEPLNNLAVAYTKAGARAKAEDCFKLAFAIGETLSVRNSAYATVLMNYAEFLRRTGRKREAARLQARSKEALVEVARTNGIGATVDVSSFRGK